LLADNKVELELAKGYAEKAVAELESRSVKNAEDDDIALPLAGQLATIWDTLGWIYFQSGDLTRAQDLIRASWLLSQSSGVGDHLGQIYERQGKKNQAEHIYQLALVGGNMLRISLPGTESSQSLQADIGARYEAIRAARYKLAGNAPTLEIRRLPNGEWTPTPEEELSRMRKTRIVSPTAPSGSAEFSIVFSPAKVEAVRYVSGDSAIKSMAQKLATAKYGMVFPAGSAAIVVRRATIVCSRSSGCDVVLHLPESTNIPVFLPPDAQ
jgi:tetratricopeptide (TPR) repeat protein